MSISITRTITRTTGLVGFSIALAAFATETFAHAQNSLNRRPEDLLYCYAKGTDAIGDASVSLDDAKAIYDQCFTEDATFHVWFPNQPFTSQADPDPEAAGFEPTATSLGPDAWADFVESVFRGNGYDFTQHIISNVSVSREDGVATIVGYLNASHIIAGEGVGGISQCVAIANGVYTQKARREPGQWRVFEQSLTLTTFDPVFESGDGC